MRSQFNRRTATKVKGGRVQRKNRHRPTVLQGYILDRDSPRRGFRHVVSKGDLQAFTDLIPDWQQLSQRLERIVLANCPASDGEYAFYHREQTGAIFLDAWNEDLWVGLDLGYFSSHREIFECLGVSFDVSDDRAFCRFTAAQARAFMLLHVFMHELGHHYDRMNQKHRDSSRGEDHAERFATSRFAQLYEAYVGRFGDPARGD
jgi:hypothetical protein